MYNLDDELDNVFIKLVDEAKIVVTLQHTEENIKVSRRE